MEKTVRLCDVCCATIEDGDGFKVWMEDGVVHIYKNSNGDLTVTVEVVDCCTETEVQEMIHRMFVIKPVLVIENFIADDISF